MYQRVTIEEAKNFIGHSEIIIFDVRDELSYQAGHIAGANHLGRENLQEVCNTLPKDQKILIYCYRGNSSQMIAQMLLNFGFTQVLSMDGGFEAWKEKFPIVNVKQVEEELR